jgi:hypothetical protein
MLAEGGVNKRASGRTTAERSTRSSSQHEAGGRAGRQAASVPARPGVTRAPRADRLFFLSVRVERFFTIARHNKARAGLKSGPLHFCLNNERE